MALSSKIRLRQPTQLGLYPWWPFYIYFDILYIYNLYFFTNIMNFTSTLIIYSVGQLDNPAWLTHLSSVPEHPGCTVGSRTNPFSFLGPTICSIYSFCFWFYRDKDPLLSNPEAVSRLIYSLPHWKTILKDNVLKA